MDRQYCPKCKCWVGGENVDMNFHSCGCRVVPAYSRAMRLEADLKAKDELLFAYESVKAPVNPLLDENAKQKDALERIQVWANAYPLDVFPKPDLKKAAKVLKAAGMTLDAISADNMRHVLDGIKDIVEQAPKGE